MTVEEPKNNTNVPRSRKIHLVPAAPPPASLPIPVDVIFGQQVLDYRTYGERLVSALPNAKLHVIDGGHMIPVTAPDQIINWSKRLAV
jgi:pimeloyl-ACP methyl ester carboxylesterase